VLNASSIRIAWPSSRPIDSPRTEGGTEGRAEDFISEA